MFQSINEFVDLVHSNDTKSSISLCLATFCWEIIDIIMFGTCRQKRSMGLTVAAAELARLDQERVRDRVTLERERSYAESIITKIEDIL